MDSEHNPQLADILRKLKHPYEAGVERPHSPTSADQVLPGLTNLAAKPTLQGDKAFATADPRRGRISPLMDPSKITTWPAAQKYVIENIYRNQTLASKIKHLIDNQHGQERQWWAEKGALISKHRGRAEKEKQVAAMLQSMGGIAASTMAPNLGEEEAELRGCDLKIHKAMTKLAMDIDRELRSTGVPFYAIKHELVILEERKDGGVQLGKIGKGELKELQKRMLQLLEELFED